MAHRFHRTLQAGADRGDPHLGTSGGSSRLESLTGLRFAAAFAVFGLHLILLMPVPEYAHLTRVFVQGTTGVSFFFVLSGFVLTWSQRPGDHARAFYRRRFARIYPLHALTWAGMGAVLLALSTLPGAGSAALSLVLLSPWVPVLHYSQVMNVPAWSLGCEAFFYALFPLLVGWIDRMRPDHRRVLLVAAVAAIVALSALCAPASYGTVRYWALYFFPPTRLLEFVIGMVLAVEVREGRWPVLPALPLGLLALGAYLAAGWAPPQFRLVTVTLVPFTLLIAACAQRDVAGQRSMWSSRPLVLLGAWSFAFYLVQYPMLTAVSLILARHHVRVGLGGAVALGLVSLVVAVVISGIAHRCFERPLERRLRSGRGGLTARRTRWTLGSASGAPWSAGGEAEAQVEA
jgi:peptidoglycan/LPS O-acetylase OafA/YrhL